mgnify:CR=1 FL=1
MIDFHTHILPGVDDGSPNLDVTCGMLREEQEQQVGLVVATPHFYAQETGFDAFLLRRQEALSQVRALDGIGSALPQVVAGAEILYFPGIGRASRVRELAVAGTNTILLEMPFAQCADQIGRASCRERV